MDVKKYLVECQARVNDALDKTLPLAETTPETLHQAMRYAVLGGGKRIRPSYVYAIGEAFHANPGALDVCSVAIELVHAFSLVHDDLPAIDNDNLRHGKPALHKAYGEGVAILAGDALLTLSFEVLATLENFGVSAVTIVKMIKALGHFAGSCGMAGGEVLDVLAAKHAISLPDLATIYQLKTSYLFCLSILLGAMAANHADAKDLDNLEKFGLYLGLAFQIHDDVLDVEASTEVLGKPQHSDEKNHKPTYPQLIGLAQSKAREKEYFSLAISYLEKIDIKTEKLVALSKFVISRSN